MYVKPSEHSPQVCFVFGCKAWPVLCHFCMGSLHYFLYKHQHEHPLTVPHGEFTHLHPERHKDETRTVQLGS